MIRCLFVVALAASANLASAAESAPEPELRIHAIAKNLHVLFGRGGNVGVFSGADGVYLIDDKYAPMSAQIQAAVSTLSEQPIRFVFNTHWHSDHTGGNENLGAGGSIIVAHDNVRQRLSSEQFMTAFQRKVEPSPKQALPLVTFESGLTLHLNGDSVHSIHVPHAHTDGDSLVHFQKANVVHMGDTFFNGMYPFIDLSSGGSIDGVIAAVDRGLALSDKNTVIVPGHGPISDRTGLLAYRDMLTTLRARIAKQVDSGRSIEAIVDSAPTQSFDEVWGGGFITPEAMVRTIAESLQNPPPHS